MTEKEERRPRPRRRPPNEPTSASSHGGPEPHSPEFQRALDWIEREKIRPVPPDWVLLLMDKKDPSWFILEKLNEDALDEFLAWYMTKCQTKRQLEQSYEVLRLCVNDTTLIDRLYYKMWHVVRKGRS